MHYAVRYHEGCGEWLVFNIDDQFELVGTHSSEADAVQQVMKFEERDRKRQRFARRAELSAA